MKGSKPVLMGALASMVIVGLLVGGCGPTATPPPTVGPGVTPTVPAVATPTAPPAAPKVLRIATAGGCGAMSVGEAGGAGPCAIQIEQMYQGLTFRNWDATVQPLLATSWEMIEPTVWQFKLREGVKFHNGEDFNAEAVVYSFETAMDEERAWAVKGKLGFVASVEIVDDYTVDIHTSQPWLDAPFFAAAVFMMPPKYAAEVGPDEGLVTDPVGTGPFQFVEFVPNDYMKLKAFDDYWGGRPKIDEILWRQIPEPATRVAALLAGDVDIAVQVPGDLIPVVKASPGADVDFARELTTIQLFMDGLPATQSPLADKRVRQAIDYAIDKKMICEALLGEFCSLNGQVLTPEVFGYNPDIEQTPYDPEKARQLLAEAGYPNGLTVKMICPLGKFFVDRDAVVAIKEQLAQVGINVEPLSLVDAPTFTAALKAPTERQDMLYLGWYSYGNPAQAFQWFSTAQPWHRWENDEFDQQFDVAQTSLDEQERLEAYYRMAEIIKDETPSVFLWQQPAPYGISDKVEGFKPHPNQSIVLAEVDLLQ